jgi:hypothetical protein
MRIARRACLLGGGQDTLVQYVHIPRAGAGGDVSPRHVAFAERMLDTHRISWRSRQTLRRCPSGALGAVSVRAPRIPRNRPKLAIRVRQATSILGFTDSEGPGRHCEPTSCRVVTRGSGRQVRT